MSKLEIVRIPAEGSPTETVRINRSLEAAQQEVGGYIEAVGFDVGSLYLNEDWIAMGLPINVRATMLARIGRGIEPRGFILGDVMVFGGVDSEGETVDVTPELIERIKLIHARCLGAGLIPAGV